MINMSECSSCSCGKNNHTPKLLSHSESDNTEVLKVLQIINKLSLGFVIKVKDSNIEVAMDECGHIGGYDSTEKNSLWYFTQMDIHKLNRFIEHNNIIDEDIVKLT